MVNGLVRESVIMSNDKLTLPASELVSSTYLLQRFDDDIQKILTQLSFLEITFENLKGTWIAISQTHKVFKMNIEEEL